MFLALDTLDIVANVEFSMLGRLWTRRGIGSVDEGVVASVAGEYEELDTIGLTDFLNFDPKPTLIFDLLRHNAIGDNLDPVYMNKTFQSNVLLTSTISPSSEGQTSPVLHSGGPASTTFRSLIKDFVQKQTSEDYPGQSFSYNGFLWGTLSTTFSDKTIAALKDVQVSNLNSPASGAQNQNEDVIMSEMVGAPSSDWLTESPVADWTVERPEGYLSDHIVFTRSVDWSSTPLGPMNSWSPEFRQIVNMVIANPHPAAIFWGEELTVLYNQTYAENVAGQKHPRLMGTGARGPFAEIWEEVGEIFNECRRTGRGIAMTDQMLPLERQGFVEETFYSWSLTPIWKSGPSPELLGVYNAPFETTQKVVSNRRMRTLLKVGEETALAQSVPDFWQLMLGGLAENEYDFPFVLLYSVLDDIENDATSSRGSISSDSSTSIKSVILEGSLGVPKGHVSAQSRLDLKRHLGGYVPALREAMKTRQPTLLSLSDSMLPVGLTRGYNWRGFVIGVNPRRPYDADYDSFVKILNRQLANSLASVTLFQDEIRRGTDAAEIAAAERMKLSEELAFQKGRLQRIAEVSPVALFSVDSDGTLLEANDRYYEITNLPRDTASKMSWMNTIAPSSIPTMMKGWEKLTIRNKPWSGELQLVKPWYDPVTGDKFDNWILASYQHEFSSDGSIKSIMGYCTDITFQKRFAKEMEDRAELSEQLLLRTNQANEIERNFRRFSDLAPGGLAILDPEGRLTYANEQWFHISGLAKKRNLFANSLLMDECNT
ncbi:Hybrid signal transduction histidine kinase K 1 [Botrytis cinerea]